VFERVENFSSTEFDKFSTASLITRSTNDITQIQMVVIMMMRMVIYAPIIGVGGVIRALHRHDAAAQRRMLCAQIIRKFLLGLRRSDDQYFVRARERLRDFVEELVIGRRLMPAMCALAAVHAGLAVRVNHRVFLFGRGELPDGGLLVIDPYNGVKMRHGNAF
jgi:ABC-type multidrug transport system fused ATPase/permease subunit